MTVRSRDKGKRGERELAAVLTEQGFQAERAQQYKGGQHSADIHCPALEALGFHIEVKRVETQRINEWIRQATEDAGDRLPVVAHRPNRGEWVVVMRLSDFCAIARRIGGGA